MNKIIKYFPETDMRNGHFGLMKLAKKAGVNVQTMSEGSFVVFTNRRLTKLKVFGGGGRLVTYLSLPSGRIDLNTIKSIPKYFNGGEFNYNRALKSRINRSL